MRATTDERSAKQRTDRILEALEGLREQWQPFGGCYHPFHAIQRATGIPPCELGPMLDKLVADGAVEESALGGYRLASGGEDGA